MSECGGPGPLAYIWLGTVYLLAHANGIVGLVVVLFCFVLNLSTLITRA